jgi:hypothetical protein
MDGHDHGLQYLQNLVGFHKNLQKRSGPVLSVHRKPVGFSLKFKILRNFVTKKIKKLESRRKFMVKNITKILTYAGYKISRSS